MSALEQPKCSDVISIWHLEFDTYQSVLHPGKDLDAVVTNLDEFFVPKQNEVYAWYLFHCRKQQPGETFETLITNLKLKAKLC